MNLVVVGASGRMGQALIRAVSATPGARVCAAIERRGAESIGRDAGELAGYGGNLYLFADGVEIGSLFFHTVDGRLRVALGQFDPQGGWVERNPVGVVTDLPGGAEMLAGLAPVGD